LAVPRNSPQAARFPPSQPSPASEGRGKFIGKPWHDYELRAAIDLALSHHEMELENRFLTDLLLLKEKH